MEKLHIVKAENAGNLTVNLTFSPHPQYNKYLDPRIFNRFTIDNGNVVWGKNWDLIFPIEQLHSGVIA